MIQRTTRYIYTYPTTLRVPANAAVQGLLFERGPGISLTRCRLRGVSSAPLYLLCTHVPPARARARVFVFTKKFHAPQRFRLTDEPLRIPYRTASHLYFELSRKCVTSVRFHFVTSSRTRLLFIRIAIIYT